MITLRSTKQLAREVASEERASYMKKRAEVWDKMMEGMREKSIQDSIASSHEQSPQFEPVIEEYENDEVGEISDEINQRMDIGNEDYT